MDSNQGFPLGSLFPSLARTTVLCPMSIEEYSFPSAWSCSFGILLNFGSQAAHGSCRRSPRAQPFAVLLSCDRAARAMDSRHSPHAPPARNSIRVFLSGIVASSPLTT